VNAPSIAITEERAPDVLGRARALIRALTVEAPSDVDGGVVELAFAEGLAPWLGARVGQGRVIVPGSAAAPLAWEHQMCLASNIVRAHAAGAFVERCRQDAIPVAWLKGMALIHGIIAPGERSMVDVDLLVPAARWDDACTLAAAIAGAQQVTTPGRGYTTMHDYVRAFSLPSGVTLEVHRSVCESSLFAIDHDELFARAVHAASGVAVLDEGDLFLTLAVHAAKHTFELPLRSFLDGVVLLQRGLLNLGQVQERARRWRMEKALHLWLHALRTLAPAGIEGAAGAPPPLAGLLWSRTSDLAAWQRFLRLAWITDGPADWARHVLTRVAFRLRDVAGAGRSP